MDEELISAFGTHEKLMPYLHLPVQSGSDRILKAMNRKHTSKSYKQIIKSLRSIRPDLLLSGDFIVGFPGETDLDFQETLDLVREVKFGQAYSFRYSARPGTPAAEKDAVPKEIAVERLHKLQALLTIQQKEVQSNMVGKTLSVLFEKPGRKVGQLIGKSEYLHAVHVVAPTEFIGTVKSVKVVESLTNSLSGELLI
jgi:tRNA-2-methylthio-N6-dimethylallyladenosine synthase